MSTPQKRVFNSKWARISSHSNCNDPNCGPHLNQNFCVGLETDKTPSGDSNKNKGDSKKEKKATNSKKDDNPSERSDSSSTNSTSSESSDSNQSTNESGYKREVNTTPAKDGVILKQAPGIQASAKRADTNTANTANNTANTKNSDDASSTFYPKLNETRIFAGVLIICVVALMVFVYFFTKKSKTSTKPSPLQKV